MSILQTSKLSYAAVVKSQPNKRTNTTARPKSWYEQIVESEKETIKRSNSVSTFFSDDVRSNITRHSEDSGQISDMSSDNEYVSGRSQNGNEIGKRQKRTAQMEFQRRESVDSCGTSSISSSRTCCSDPTCTSDHSQFQMMCQQWRNNKVKEEIETNEGVLARRQKQIDYGKNTIGYELYRKEVSTDQQTKDHPKTPDMHKKYSRRAFDGLIRKWRKQLHKFDPSCVDDHEEESSDQLHSSDDDKSTE
ncbi:histone RNA hairpin-binding protein-like [Contarinia nasturtii]|uniref:histone RNA hairpin-binding protein-like n=1 Tax=Contarinia nasturtii TaxID=265458 RepID=UPI0012D3E4BA|nr:histone RNA hairpin-binding protein-like [Contarinia nasturtii]